QTVWHTTGLYSGEPIREQVEKLIFRETGIPFFTFGDLYDAILQGKPYKHLYLFADRLTTQRELIVLNSENLEWEEVILSDAITGCMLKAPTYNPHLLHIR